jgi:YbbR domain-containing protein
MKRFFLENWQAKLMSLIVATALWYLIKKNVDSAPEPLQPERRPVLPARGR